MNTDELQARNFGISIKLYRKSCLLLVLIEIQFNSDCADVFENQFCIFVQMAR